mmetsp:Transcript_11343/g.18226  ORF Transcript_11343/g.18226 Transcript_11343/m.18226 type:complete len:133 (+) Transcript_11343:1109-1507(+)
MLYLCIVTDDDLPIFQMHFGAKAQKEDLNQFIIHAALDLVDKLEKTSNNMYLGQVDKFNEFLISAFVCIGTTRFLLLHNKSMREDVIKKFFLDVYYVYLKLLMNPFYLKGSPIENMHFQQEIQRIGKLHFKV